MEVDKEARVFKLSPEDAAALQYNPVEETVPFEEVGPLHVRIRQEIELVSQWNAWDEPTHARRNYVLAERAHRIRVLGLMETQLMPIAEEAAVDEAERLLRGDDSLG